MTPKPVSEWNWPDRLAVFAATGAGVSLLAEAATRPLTRAGNFQERWTGAGLAGTAAALAWALAGAPVSGWAGAAHVAFWTALGLACSGRAEKIFGRKDDSRIVIDEIAGFFWSVSFLPAGRGLLGETWALLLTAFVLFRICDVLKLPSRRVQNLGGGLGVMTDDVLAGMLANAVLQAALRLPPVH